MTTHRIDRDDARAFPSSDALQPRLIAVESEGVRLPQTRQRLRPNTLAARMIILSINLGTMMGKSREVAHTMERRKIDLACVQETNWKGAKAREAGGGFKLFYNGGNLNGNV